MACSGFAAADQECVEQSASRLDVNPVQVRFSFRDARRHEHLFLTSTMWVWGLDVFRDEAAALPALVLHVILTSMASEMYPKPCTSFDFSAMFQQWPFRSFQFSGLHVQPGSSLSCDSGFNGQLWADLLEESRLATSAASLHLVHLVRLCLYCRGLRFSRFPQPCFSSGASIFPSCFCSYMPNCSSPRHPVSHISGFSGLRSFPCSSLQQVFFWV